jgi:uncharacterized protein YigA (DUF484 family)
MNDKTALNAATVAQYLTDHPDFLLSHPDVLSQLQLPHESGQAVSLIERQVDQLRERNELQKSQLNQLMRVARDNEVLMTRLHDLTVELMTIGDLGAFFDRLSEVLLEELEADVLNITLYDREIHSSDATPLFNSARDEALLEPVKELLDKGESRCGRLNRAKLDALFRSKAQWVQSTALVPIDEHGFMAIGSSDPARFYPGMGTLFLDMLAKVIETRLLMEKPEQQRRSA